MSKVCSMHREEECIQVFGGKAKKKTPEGIEVAEREH
jgi:hypothetical protein